jgi:hypothetical protein
MLRALIRRLAQQIAGKQQPRADLLCLQRATELVARERRIRLDADREVEPAGIGIRRRLGQDQELLERVECGPQIREIFLAGWDRPGREDASAASATLQP